MGVFSAGVESGPPGNRQATLCGLHADSCLADRSELEKSGKSFPARSVGVAREGIDPAEEGPAHDPLNTVINPDLIRDHDIRALPPCHARMLHMGSRCLGPGGRRPCQRHDHQTYRGWNRLFSSQWNCGWPQMSPSIDQLGR